MQLNTRKNN